MINIIRANLVHLVINIYVIKSLSFKMNFIEGAQKCAFFYVIIRKQQWIQI